MALAANRTLNIHNNVGKTVHSGTVTAAKTVYKHALLVTEATNVTVEPATDLTTTKFAGLAAHSAAAGETVEYYNELEVSIPVQSDLIQADGGKICYCYDDESVCEANTAGPPCGVFLGIDPDNASNGIVRLGYPVAKGVAS